jgi:hypothetical protein
MSDVMREKTERTGQRGGVGGGGGERGWERGEGGNRWKTAAGLKSLQDFQISGLPIGHIKQIET